MHDLRLLDVLTRLLTFHAPNPGMEWCSRVRAASMKDALAPGPLDESYVVSRTHFRYCVEGHHRLHLWNSGIFRRVQRAMCVCVRVGQFFPPPSLSSSSSS